MVVTNVLDGGLGTLVQSRGAFQLNGDDLWVSSCLRTEQGRLELKRAHLDYLRAGADIIKTASYQISVPLLKRSLPEITEVIMSFSFHLSFCCVIVIVIVFILGEMFGFDARIGAHCTQRLSGISPIHSTSK